MSAAVSVPVKSMELLTCPTIVSEDAYGSFAFMHDTVKLQFKSIGDQIQRFALYITNIWRTIIMRSKEDVQYPPHFII